MGIFFPRYLQVPEPDSEALPRDLLQEGSPACATIHENFVVLLVPGFLSARFVCGNGLWWKVYTSARPYRTRWTLPNSQQFLQEVIFPAVRWGRPKFTHNDDRLRVSICIGIPIVMELPESPCDLDCFSSL